MRQPSVHESTDAHQAVTGPPRGQQNGVGVQPYRAVGGPAVPLEVLVQVDPRDALQREVVNHECTRRVEHVDGEDVLELPGAPALPAERALDDAVRPSEHVEVPVREIVGQDQPLTGDRDDGREGERFRLMEDVTLQRAGRLQYRRRDRAGRARLQLAEGGACHEAGHDWQHSEYALGPFCHEYPQSCSTQAEAS